MVRLLGYLRKGHYFQLPKYERQFYELSVGVLMHVTLRNMVRGRSEEFISRVQSCHRIYVPKLFREYLRLEVGDLLEVNVVKLPDRKAICRAKPKLESAVPVPPLPAVF